MSAEQRVSADYPLRSMRAIVDEALTGLSSHFDRLYAKMGPPSIAPEKLVRALLLQALYSVRSKRQLMESERLLLAVVDQAQASGLLSGGHFTVGGKLIQA